MMNSTSQRPNEEMPEPASDTHTFPTHLLATKFFVPMPPHALIARSRLTQILDAGFHQHIPLILVSAAAGFGKTTLLAAWIRSFPPGHPSVAWVSLDTRDNAPVQFWTYVLTALDACQPGLGTTPFASLHEEPQPAWQSMLTALINTLAQRSEPLLLVLDNYEEITEPTIHALISSLIEHLPSPVCVVLATRADPPFSLARLRARAQILELRTELLRSTEEEEATFLREGMDLHLSEQEIQEVKERTQGWWAGLQLAALALRGRAHPMDLLHELRGNQRAIRDYLVHEVLQRQSAAVQTFLLRTSILDRFSAPLCDALLEQQESQQLLAELERANLFLQALDQHHRWYMYHPLFAEALRSHLEQTAPAEVPALHVRASHWYAAQHMRSEAIEHALRAREWPWAADLIEHLPSQRIWNRLAYALLPSWIEQLPPEVAHTRPRLCLASAQALFWTAPPEVAERWLRDAREAWAVIHAQEEHTSVVDSKRELAAPTSLLGEIAALQAVMAGYYHGDAGATRALCQEALTHLGPQQWATRVQVALAQAIGDFSSGHLASSNQKMQDMSMRAQAEGDLTTSVLFMSRASLGMILSGKLHQAWQFLQHTIQRVTTPDGHLPALAYLLYTLQAEILREWNRLEEAHECAEQAIRMAEQTETIALLQMGYSVLLRIELSQGALECARTTTQCLEDAWKRMPSPYRFAIYSSVEQIRFWLACGEVAQANAWAHQVEHEEPLISPLAQVRQQMALVRVWLAESHPDKALDLLASLERRARVMECWNYVIEIQVLQTLAYQMCDQQQAARSALSQALHLAAPESYIRRFADEGPSLANILCQLREPEQHREPHAYLDTLLMACNQACVVPSQPVQVRASAPPQPLLDPLSARELEVLHLVAQGASNQAIADTFVISVDTVKHHVSNILSKLEVTNRTQAVARARILGLLSHAG